MAQTVQTGASLYDPKSSSGPAGAAKRPGRPAAQNRLLEVDKATADKPGTPAAYSGTVTRRNRQMGIEMARLGILIAPQSIRCAPEPTGRATQGQMMATQCTRNRWQGPAAE